MGDFSTATSTEKSWGTGSVQDYAEWASFYKVIAYANLVIAKIDQTPDNVFSSGMKDKLLGEAYYLRALTYFNILRIWGNAPYISESIESSEQVINSDLVAIVIPRTSDVEIGKYVLEDVNIAVKKLSYGTVGSSEWGIRANKGSAEALAGHVNMWMYFLAQKKNLPNKEVYLKDAITALEDAVNRGNYSFVDYQQGDAIAKLYEGGSTEAVFELNVSFSENESYRADYSGIESYTCIFTPLDGDEQKNRASYVNWIPYSQKIAIYPEYDISSATGDIRPNLFFTAWQSTYEEPFSDISTVSTNRNLVTSMKKYNLLTVDPMRQWDEYVSYFAEANIPVFRYTDIYLLLAEAYCKDNQSGKALPMVNTIRRRAGLDPYRGADLEKEVLQQRISELIGEGHLYYDMVRNNYFPNQQIMEPARYAAEGYYWPVSSNILTKNKLISQTPYWSGKTDW
jgi:hypothetical protein